LINVSWSAFVLENRMEKSPSRTADNRLLFSTEKGSVRHCVSRDTLVLEYRGHWLPLSRSGYRAFHERLIESVRCPLGQRRLNEGGLFAFRTESGHVAFTLDRPGMEDLLWLLDSARFMLDAGDAVILGYYGSVPRTVQGQEDPDTD
jgi:hypothetical protein